MPRPPSMPKPRLRKGAKTYEIRVRVPDAARGGRFRGTHTTRTLNARSETEAYRNLPDVHDALMREFAAEQALLVVAGEPTVATADTVPEPPTAPPQARQLPRELTIPELCRRYRAYVLHSERKRRELFTWMHKSLPGMSYKPKELADWYKHNVQTKREAAEARRVVRDFDVYEGFLKELEGAGVGRVVDRRRALQALCRTELEALDAIVRSDSGRRRASPKTTDRRRDRRPEISPTQRLQRSEAPTLSRFIEAFIERRGSGISDERAQSYRAVVRDLIEVTTDKPVSDYVIGDAEAFEAVLRALPANWRKKKELKHLSMAAAAKKARADGLEAQAPKNVRKKWTMLGSVFKQATARHGGQNPFQPDLLQIDKGQAANAQWDAFAADELAKLMGSKLEGPLYWLTRLALYTGARTNELCQLTTDHVKCHEGVHYIYFSPELRLKTGEKQSCVRSVPLRRELIEEGFLDFVAKADGELFPGLTQHSTGRYSDAVGKKFTYHLKKIGLKRPKLSFKSLRHTFVAEFKRCAPTDVETRERLVGHAVSGVAGRYGNSYEAEALDMELLKARAGVLDKLRFDFARLQAVRCCESF